MIRTALLLCLLSLAAAANAQQRALLVTTDTEQYCDHLWHLAAQHRKAAPEAQKLAHEGAVMCDHGAVRAGIARLRRALLLMRSGTHPIPH